MPSAIGVAGEVLASAVALAGLILVFLGAVASSFGSYQKAEQATVRARYQLRAWFAFVGFTLALLSAILALIAKWLTNDCAALAAVALLAAALIWVLLAALLAVRDIR